jgi:UDP-N-acetylmuramoylalanine--D-glutamate ligase
MSVKKKMVVLGAGISGAGAAVLAARKGYDVFVSEKGTIDAECKALLERDSILWEEGVHSLSRILEADEVIKSPGIPDNAPIVKSIREKNIPLISEIEFAGRHTRAKTICITGSNGKTTTTLLTYHMLKKAGLNVGVAGNVGKSFALQVAENNHDHYVLELSSFQLDNMYEFRADISVLLNITPDHLDRYDYDMQNYVNSKFRIIQNQREDDVFIYCADDPVTREEVNKRNILAHAIPFSLHHPVEEGAYTENEQLIIKYKQTDFSMSIFDLALQGRHNMYNSMAAAISGRVLDIRKDLIRESLADFQNIEHRLEFVAAVHGIEFINDSKATNINSTWFALESMEKPVIWIVGGVDKGNDYSMLHELVKEKVKGIVCMGKENAKIIESFGEMFPQIIETSSAEEAVKAAYLMGRQGDVVLLSPACASFDLFKNYEDRGRQFKSAVRAL